MPVYDYSCEEHGRWDELLHVSQSSTSRHCPKCGNVGLRLYPPVSKHRVAFTPHFNSGADRWFDSKRELHTWCSKNNTGIKTNTGAITFG